MTPALALIALTALLAPSLAAAARGPGAWNTPAGSIGAAAAAARRAGGADANVAVVDPRVSLDLYVMSMCPDANFCEHALAPVVERLNSIVQVKTRYIQHFDDVGAVVCKHGAPECRGNLLQLCVQAHVPPEHNYDWFYRFLVCGWDSGLPANDTARLDGCLRLVGVDSGIRGSIQGCYDGSEGTDLMVDNTRLVDASGVANSCTVVIDGKQRCIRDGGEWRDCPGGSEEGDFFESLCDAYTQKTNETAPACLPPPA